MKDRPIDIPFLSFGASQRRRLHRQPARSSSSRAEQCSAGRCRRLPEAPLVDAVAKQRLDSFQSLTGSGVGVLPDFEHCIVLSDDARPVARSLHPLLIARRQAVDAEIDRILSAGIWEPAGCPCAWTHHLVTVVKSDSGVWITTDLSPLNRFVIMRGQVRRPGWSKRPKMP